MIQEREGSKVFLSVIVPYYNSEKYLCRCFESLKRNMSRELEFICVDDGSTDKSHSIFEEFQKEDPRFVDVRIPHEGVSAARNAGLSICKGEYLCFVDSDDYVLKNGFGRLLIELKKENPDLLVHKAKLKGFGKEDWMKKPLKIQSGWIDTFKIDDIFTRNGFIPFLWLHIIKRRIIFDNCLKFNTDLVIGEDQDFIIQYMFNVRTVLFLEINAYCHRIREYSVMSLKRQDPEEYCIEQVKMLESVHRLFSKHDYNSPLFFDWLFNSLYWSCEDCSKETRLKMKERIIHLIPNDFLKGKVAYLQKLC